MVLVGPNSSSRCRRGKPHIQSTRVYRRNEKLVGALSLYFFISLRLLYQGLSVRPASLRPLMVLYIFFPVHHGSVIRRSLFMRLFDLGSHKKQTVRSHLGVQGVTQCIISLHGIYLRTLEEQEPRWEPTDYVYHSWY